MTALKVDQATRTALAAGDLRAATRALLQANPSLQLTDLPTALKSVRQAVDGARQGGTAVAADAAQQAKAAVAATVQQRAAAKRVPTVAPGDSGSLFGMRLLAMVTVAALFAAAWWLAGGG